MNDRFAGELRRHLILVADDRVTDDQLARVLHAVATTPQRHPVAARLASGRRRIGSLPTTAIRFGLLAAALALATMTGASLGAGSGEPRTVFEGTWITIDPGDGSGMSLVIGPGLTPVVYFEDGYASGAACVDDAVKRFTARGTAEITGDRLIAEYPDGGGCGLMTVEVMGVYDYDRDDDALVDQDGLLWTRALPEERPERPEPPAPETPEAEVPATEAPVVAPEPRATSAPPSLGLTYSSSVHGISLAYPEGWQVRPATEPWTAGELGFDSPAADVIVDPARGDGLFLTIGSQPYGGLSEDEWRGSVLGGMCSTGGAFGSWVVDGFDAFALQCEAGSAAVIFTPTRGYVIRLHLPPDDAALAEALDWDWFRPLLETVELRPSDAMGAP